MSENKFISRLKGKASVKSLVEIQKSAIITPFSNIPNSTPDSTFGTSDSRDNSVVMAKSAKNWIVNNSALSISNSDNYISEFDISGNTLWLNSSYVYPASTNPDNSVVEIIGKSSKWVFRLCGKNLLSNNENISFTLVVKAGTTSISHIDITTEPQAGFFCKQFEIDFSESDSDLIKISGGESLVLQLLCNDATANATIYNGKTILTLLQAKVDGDVISSNSMTFDDIEQNVNQLTEDLADEITAREEADSTLQDNIDTVSGDLASHIEDTDNPHATTAAQVGLGNVDNTSDADKPISDDTQAALDLKANDNAVVHLTGDETIAGTKIFTSNQFIGTKTSGANEVISGTLNATEKFTSFVVASNWTLTSGWESTNNSGTQLNKNAAGTTTALFLQNAPVVGNLYKVSITVYATVAGGFTVGYGAQTTANINPTTGTSTTYDLYFIATAVTNLTFTPVTTARFVITAISIKQVGADATGNLTVDNDIKLAGKIYHKNGTLGLQIAPNGAAVFNSTLAAVGVNIGGALSGASTGAFSGAVTTTQTTTTTPVTGLVATTREALVGTPVRISPSVYWNSTAWNTTPTAASKANAIQAYYLPVSGAATYGSLLFTNATVDGVANTDELMRINYNKTVNIGGLLGYTPNGGLLTIKGSNATYGQAIISNISNANTASSDLVVNNDISTDTTTYGDFGINSSTYTGTGSFNLANATYLSSNGGDLVLGTTTANTIRFVYNGGATDAMTIGSTGVLVPTPTTDYQVANKKYVDDNAGGGSAILPTGTCSTAGATAAKEVSVSGYTETAGACALITFANKNTVADALTLNINSGGAKSILHADGTAVSATNPAYFIANCPIQICSDGTNYRFNQEVVKTYISGTSWYRLYNDGWVEQGGIITTTSADITLTVTLPVVMANANYTWYRANGDGVSGQSLPQKYACFLNRTVSTIQIPISVSVSPTSWEVKGMAA